MRQYKPDPAFHDAVKVEEKCSCVHDEDEQDWNMTARNSWPLLKPITGLVAPEFDSPNYRWGLFSHDRMTKPPERSKYMPFHPWGASGAASLDPANRPVWYDVPKYGGDTTGGSRWPLMDPMKPASPDPRGSFPGDSVVAEPFTQWTTYIMLAGGLMLVLYIWSTYSVVNWITSK
jgi:hypothetical protein